MRKTQKTREEDLLATVERLEACLAEAEETLRAIRNGEVDALVTSTTQGDQVFTLTGAERPYRVMVETMNEGAVTLAADGTILFCNQRFAEMVKTPLEKILGDSIYRFIAPGEKTSFEDLVRQTEKGERKELSLQTADGSSIPVLLSLNNLCGTTPDSLCLLATDITDLRRAQHALQESHHELERRVEERTHELRESEGRSRTANQRLQALMEAVPVGVSFSDDARCRHITGNPAVLKQFEIGPEDNLSASAPEDHVPGRRMQFFRDGRRLSDAELPLQRAVAENRVIPPMELEVKLPSGRSWFAEVSGAPIHNPQDNIIGGIAVTVDITTRKEAEAKLRERTLQLELANKEMESFSYSISHDLQAPLRAIDGFTRMLVQSHQETFDEETKRKFLVIRDSVQKMGQLITDLLAFSRTGRQSPSLSVMDMEELVNDVWQEQCAVNPGRNLELRRNGSLPKSLGDRALIRQVLSNLLSNAVKFTKNKGTTLIEISGKSAEKENIYTLKDNGVGFDMKYYDKLFGVFQRLHGDSEYEGTGVGLAIVKQIINRHGGRVWGEGKINEGATFSFSLPAPK